MSKYDPLGSYLSNQKRNHIPMTFQDIERILGIKLPASKQYPAWWSNNTSNNVMTQQWLNAGYQTESVDTASGRLVFHRFSPAISSNIVTNNPDKKSSDEISEPLTNPVFGSMKGTITIPDGVDLTEPADPEWSKIVDELIEEKHPQS